MPYIIAEPCINVKDKACVEVCPVDCIYEGETMLYIHPDECIDCGACEPECPVKAIFAEDERSEEHTSELQSLAYLVCRLLLEKKKKHLAIMSHDFEASPATDSRDHCRV